MARGEMSTPTTSAPRAAASSACSPLPQPASSTRPLSLDGLGLTFDTVIDSGLFHVFDDADRARYVTSLASVLPPGGTCYLMCFSERQPGAMGPRRVRQEELRAAFSDGWAFTAIVAEAFEVNPGLGTPTAQAWLATIRRI